ncbi:MAG: ATP-binding protein, partial [Nannocystaceae bacterium]
VRGAGGIYAPAGIPAAILREGPKMRADILRQLIRAHADSDERAFRKAALQLAAAEASAGHGRIADELRKQVAQLPARDAPQSPVVDIARPRGSLAEILEGGHRDERLRDIVLTSAARDELVRVLQENRARAALERHGVTPRRKLLFHGPPGCGKTLAAAVVAGEMGLPLLTVRLASLFSRFLGATSSHVQAIFAEMPRRPGVYLFDEFDSVGQARGDGQDVGEIRRVVTAFLQFLDADRSPSIIIAATNHVELLDRAIFRRFDIVLPFEMPDEDHLRQLVALRLASYELDETMVAELAQAASGLSYADITRACEDAIRFMVLAGREEPSHEDLRQSFRAAQQRGRDHVRDRR